MGALRVMELHAPVQTVQRSSGRSATAAAAYRAAERVECERTGQVHDYSRKRGVEETALLAPDAAPEWTQDRQKLWNAAELREKRKDAQTAREVNIAFPSEFSQQQRRQAGLQIGQWMVNRYGCAVDICWHAPDREGDQRNHHAHIMFTARRFENGDWAAKKDNPLDSPKTSGEELKTFRSAVAGVMNDIAAREKLGVYVEHVSFEKRGLDREATKHLGPTASAMERRGQASDRGEENREIEQRNAAREKAHQDRKIIDIQQAREKLAQRQQARAQAERPADEAPEEFRQAAGKHQASALPPPSREEVSPVITYHPAAWTPFYADAHKRRQEMLEEQDRLYRAREDELKKQMAGLHQSIDGRNVFSRFWRRITGQTAAEKEQLAQATAAFDEIQEKKRLQAEAFEKDRQLRMEEMKEEYRRREVEMHEQQAAEARAHEMQTRQQVEAMRTAQLKQETYRPYAEVHSEQPAQETDQSPAPMPAPPVESAESNSVSAGLEAAEKAAQRQKEIQELTRKLEGPKRGMGM